MIRPIDIRRQWRFSKTTIRWNDVSGKWCDPSWFLYEEAADAIYLGRCCTLVNASVKYVSLARNQIFLCEFLRTKIICNSTDIIATTPHVRNVKPRQIERKIHS